MIWEKENYSNKNLNIYIKTYSDILSNYDKITINRFVNKFNKNSSILNATGLSAYKIAKYLFSKILNSFLGKTTFKFNLIYLFSFSIFGLHSYLLYQNFYKRKKITISEYWKQVIRNFFTIISTTFVFNFSLKIFHFKKIQNKFCLLLIKFVPTFIFTYYYNFYLESFLDYSFDNSVKHRVIDTLSSEEVLTQAKKICELGKDKASKYYESAVMIINLNKETN